MQEQIQIFASLTGLKKVRDVPIILLLNQTDVLERLITMRPISDYFKDYTGGANCFQACRFFANKFAESDQRVVGNLRIYGTCAVEESSFRGTLISLQSRPHKSKAADPSIFNPEAPPPADEKISKRYEEKFSKPLYDPNSPENIAKAKMKVNNARKRRSSILSSMGPLIQ